MNRLRALAPLLVLALLGCATGSVQSDWDPEADFSTLKTYAWFPRTRPAAPDPRLNSTLLDARIQQAVEAELAAKGYTKNTVPHNADFLVAHSVEIGRAHV